MRDVSCLSIPTSDYLSLFLAITIPLSHISYGFIFYSEEGSRTSLLNVAETDVTVSYSGTQSPVHFCDIQTNLYSTQIVVILRHCSFPFSRLHSASMSVNCCTKSQSKPWSKVYRVQSSFTGKSFAVTDIMSDAKLQTANNNAGGKYGSKCHYQHNKNKMSKLSQRQV